MAIAASVAGIMMNPSALWNEVFFVTDPTYTFQPLWIVIGASLLVAILCGLWNGTLVAYMKIQPMVATLILMIAGRGIAQLITNGLRVQITYRPFSVIGQGWFILPFSLYIVLFLLIAPWLFTRRTAIGMFIESVGDAWAYWNRVQLDFSRPGRLGDNAFIESFNATVRRECLSQHWFRDLDEAAALLRRWKEDYNNRRPHTSLGRLSPARYRAGEIVNHDRNEPENSQPTWTY